MEFGVVVVFLGIRPFGTEDETEDKAEEDKPPKGAVGSGTDAARALKKKAIEALKNAFSIEECVQQAAKWSDV